MAGRDGGGRREENESVRDSSASGEAGESSADDSPASDARVADDRDTDGKTNPDTNGETNREQAKRLREEARKRWGRAEENFDTIASKLDAADSEARAEAAWSLAELANDDPDESWKLPVESKLAPLLTDDDRWVRRGASWAVASIADEYPHRARSVLSEVTQSLADDDPLVRENGVLALADVAQEYPRAAEPALGQLAQIVREGEGVTRQYAAETLQRLAVRLDENGFPKTIEATPEIASLLADDLGVVAVTDEDGGPAVSIRGGGSNSLEDEEGEADGRQTEAGTADARGPPDEIPDLPKIVAERGDFEHLEDFGDGPLTTAAKARVRTTSDGSQHVVVVLRTLRPDAGVDASRVETAFRAWEDIDDHDHIVPVLARGSNPRPWLATEFLDGGSLRDQLGSVGFERAVWYAHCVTSAICHAHARGVVHGALRPSAVGLSLTLGAWLVPKVGDWGLGDLLAETRELPVPPSFAAPEHFAPEEFGRPDPATDVYQLGALCYALFAGRPPFVGDSAEIARKIQNRDRNPAPLSAHAEQVPASAGADASVGASADASAGADASVGASADAEPSALAGVNDLLGRALATDKRSRFETVEDFRRQFEVLADDLSLSFEL